MTHEFLKFLGTGILNTFMGYLIYIFAFSLLNDETSSLLIAYVFGVLINYRNFSKYVFVTSDKRIFFNFIIIYIVVFLINNQLLLLLKTSYGINSYVGQLICIMLVVPLMYIANKKFVFLHKDQ